MAGVSLMQQLQGYMQVTNQRQQLIAANMANVDTPGYHTQDIDFQKAIQDVTTQGGAAALKPDAIEVQGLTERPDGNNVNIDRESMMLSQTQLQYQMGVQLIKEEFHKLLTAIKEGS
jgi:flagellar basal-body rod protein FlgB